MSRRVATSIVIYQRYRLDHDFGLAGSPTGIFTSKGSTISKPGGTSTTPVLSADFLAAEEGMLEPWDIVDTCLRREDTVVNDSADFEKSWIAGHCQGLCFGRTRRGLVYIRAVSIEPLRRPRSESLGSTASTEKRLHLWCVLS